MSRSTTMTVVDEVFYTQLDELFPDDDFLFSVAENDRQLLRQITGGAKVDGRQHHNHQVSRVAAGTSGSHPQG